MVRFLFAVLFFSQTVSCREGNRSTEGTPSEKTIQQSTQLEGVRFQWVGARFSRCELSSGKALRRTLHFLSKSDVEWLEEGMEDNACLIRDKSPELRIRGSYQSLSFIEGILNFPEGKASEYNKAGYRLGNLHLRINVFDSSKAAQIFLYKDNSSNQP